MNKIIAYYSLIVTVFCVLVCTLNSEGDTDTFIGGIMFIPVIYALWQMTTELKKVEAENKRRDELRRDEEMREEIRNEITKEV